jgi:thiosulfate reductase cytochrome b subunit
MKASTQRKIWRWVHIILSIPILGYIYGPVSTIPPAAFAVKWVFMPIIIISGLWMWKGQVVKKWFRKSKTESSGIHYIKTLV